MLTVRQRMQIRRAIGHRHGLMPDWVELISIKRLEEKTPTRFALGQKSLIEVRFSHKTGYEGSEVFMFDQLDLRKTPYMLKRYGLSLEGENK